MAVFQTVRFSVYDWRKSSHLFFVTLVVAGAAAGVALVTYLLWPTWGIESSSGPVRLPVSVGGTLFNLPAAAVRMNIQRHSGSQERVDLSFGFPSLEPPEAPKRVSAETVQDAIQSIDRIFLSIAAHHDSLAPEMRVRTVYPRYLEQNAVPGPDGLSMRSFREGSPYGGEDLFLGGAPGITARCTRDGATPGMCLSERRIEGADLSFRFPRSWLARWRDVASAMDRLAALLHGSK